MVALVAVVGTLFAHVVPAVLGVIGSLPGVVPTPRAEIINSAEMIGDAVSWAGYLWTALGVGGFFALAVGILLLVRSIRIAKGALRH